MTPVTPVCDPPCRRSSEETGGDTPRGVAAALERGAGVGVEVVPVFFFPPPPKKKIHILGK